MNREDIIRIAHESHLDVYGLGTDYAKFADALERFASLVAKNDTSQERVDETSVNVHKPMAVERWPSAAIGKETLQDAFEYANTPQRTWVGLTDEEIDQICGDVGYGYIDVARAIEFKLKEKNT